MRKNILLLCIASLLLPLLASCGQWRVTSLKPQRIAFIPNGDKPGDVFIKTDDSGMDGLTFGVGVFDNDVCTIDNELKRVQVIDPDDGPKLVIGNVKGITGGTIETVSFNFNTIGTFFMDKNGTLYVQNRIAMDYKNLDASNSEQINFLPSYVLVFNKNGELQHTLGQRGNTDMPFYHIEELFVDSEGRLFVVSRSFENWRIFRFHGKERDFFMNFDEVVFADKEGEDTYNGKIETIKAYQSGEKFVISVAYYHGLRLKYRKVYDYSIADRKISKVVVNIPDPKNVLFTLVQDKHLYFWNMDRSEVKFSICNMEGSIINNVLLPLDTRKSYYADIQGTVTGKLYSYKATKKGIEILEWE